MTIRGAELDPALKANHSSVMARNLPLSFASVRAYVDKTGEGTLGAMPKQATPLSVAKVKTAKPGRYFDGDGLVLLVRKAEQKPGDAAADPKPDRAFWLFRYPACAYGGCGPRSATALAEREAEKAKAKAEAGKTQASAMTFDKVADMFVAAHDAGWRSKKYRQQWRKALRDHASPTLGSMTVAEIDTGAVMRVLEPIWRDKTETASRVRGRIGAVLDYAKARGWWGGDNSARWRGHLQNVLPKPSKVAKVEHHAALPWCEISAFMAQSRERTRISARALELLILTATRSGEVRGARWREIDIDHAVWTIPAERIKAGREHRIPLSDPALAVVRQMAELGTDPGALVFLSRVSQLAAKIPREWRCCVGARPQVGTT